MPVQRGDELVERVEQLGVGALGGEHRDADLDRHPLVADLAPRARAAPREGGVGRRLRVGDERAAAAAAGRVQVAALAERDQRLAQRRARDPELARTARARPAAACPGGSSPSLIAVPSRSTVSSNAVCERTGAKTVSARRPTRATQRGSASTRSQPLEAPEALPVGDRRVERRELDVGGVDVVLDDLVAERRARDRAGGEQLARLAQRTSAGAACRRAR